MKVKVFQDETGFWHVISGSTREEAGMPDIAFHRPTPDHAELLAVCQAWEVVVSDRQVAAKQLREAQRQVNAKRGGV